MVSPTAPVQDDEPMLTPDEEDELVERINVTPNLQPVQDDDAELFAIARKLVNPVVMVGDFDDDDDELDPTYPPPCLWDANKAVEMLIARIEHLSPTPETGLVEALTRTIRELRKAADKFSPALRVYPADLMLREARRLEVAMVSLSNVLLDEV